MCDFSISIAMWQVGLRLCYLFCVMTDARGTLAPIFTTRCGQDPLWSTGYMFSFSKTLMAVTETFLFPFYWTCCVFDPDLVFSFK